MENVHRHDYIDQSLQKQVDKTLMSTNATVRVRVIYYYYYIIRVDYRITILVNQSLWIIDQLIDQMLTLIKKSAVLQWIIHPTEPYQRHSSLYALDYGFIVNSWRNFTGHINSYQVRKIDNRKIYEWFKSIYS